MTLEKKGFPTGFWSGNMDKLMAKVGQIKNPEHMEIATKIAVANQEIPLNPYVPGKAGPESVNASTSFVLWYC